jgi:hypothetical protein
MNYFHPIAVIISLVALVGCAATGSNPVWLPPPGSVVKLQQDIAVEGRSRIYIQNGRVLDRASVSVQSPYCYLAVDRLTPSDADDFTVRPDTFEVVKSYRSRSMASVGSTQYAGRAGSDQTLSTVMELTARAQPEVRRLVCARWGMVNEDGWPTVDEMRATLGPIIEFEFAG